MKSSFNRSAIMKLAYQIFKAGRSFSEAIKRAWKVWRLKQKMETADQAVEVTYYKVSTGEERKATATRNLNLIPQAKWPKSGQVSDALTLVINYFDFTVNDWRSFRADAVVI